MDISAARPKSQLGSERLTGRQFRTVDSGDATLYKMRKDFEENSLLTRTPIQLLGKLPQTTVFAIRNGFQRRMNF